MNFIRVDAYSHQSEDGWYSVCAIGSAGGWFSYAAWRTRKHPGGLKLLATVLETAEAGRKVCEEDASDPTVQTESTQIGP
jgi:hypothetical protein